MLGTPNSYKQGGYRMDTHVSEVSEAIPLFPPCLPTIILMSLVTVRA